jgi:outer membrane protein
VVGLCSTFAEIYGEIPPSTPPEFGNCSQFEFTEQDSIDIDNNIRRRNEVFPFDFSNSPVSLSLSFSLPIFTGFDRQVQVESAIARRNDLDYQVRGLELQIRADVTEAVHNLETAYQTVLLQEENTATAREEMRLAQERYQLGAGTFLELLDSQTLTAQAEVDQIDAVFSFHQSLTALEAAVGRSLSIRPGE